VVRDLFIRKERCISMIHEFLKTAGEMVIKARENKAEEAKEYINKMLGDKDDEVKGLKVDFDDDTVKIYGKCKSQKTMEKAILVAGNINGVSKVISDGLVVIGKTFKGGKGPKIRFYTIKSGDTLSKVAKEFYGNANEYMKIFNENKGVIKDPDSIYPGQVIRIP
ncbi:MAG: peptidoglycan-binding protein LysM, partial [Candidatus Fermentibacteria bacterium]